MVLSECWCVQCNTFNTCMPPSTTKFLFFVFYVSVHFICVRDFHDLF
uniref:Uncharacterized protein n=1 Tax=uncultured bacterium A1Q1_fos_500 TaxID=1256579 RepID=L7VSI6_9BACT|nr:hypothetical protein [uncultured bacterium A1Q1_fos_500]